MGRQRRSRKGANPLAQYRTLAVYLESLEGSLVDVEFQNDIVIRGKLVSVDASINLTLEDAVVQPPNRPWHRAEVAFVRASMIRFVHIPGRCNPAGSVTSYLRRKEIYRDAHRFERRDREQRGGGDGGRPQSHEDRGQGRGGGEGASQGAEL